MQWDDLEERFEDFDESYDKGWMLPENIESDFNSCMLALKARISRLISDSIIAKQIRCSLLYMLYRLEHLEDQRGVTQQGSRLKMVKIEIRPCAMRRGLFHRILSHVLSACIRRTDIKQICIFSCGHNSQRALWHMPLPGGFKRQGEPTYDAAHWAYGPEMRHTFYPDWDTVDEDGRYDILLDRAQFESVKAAIDAKLAGTPFPTREQMQTRAQEEFCRVTHEFEVMQEKAQDYISDERVYRDYKARHAFKLKEKESKVRDALMAKWAEVQQQQAQNPDCTVCIKYEEILWNHHDADKFILVPQAG